MQYTLILMIILLSLSGSNFAANKVECYKHHKIVYRDYPLKVTNMRDYLILSYVDHDDILINGNCKIFKLQKTIDKLNMITNKK